MSAWLTKIFRAEAERLIPLAAEDPELRAELRELARAILEATEGPLTVGDPWSFSTEPESTPREIIPGSQEPPTAPEFLPVDPAEPLRELTLGRTPSHSPAPKDAGTVESTVGSDEDEPEAIAGRCQMKSEAAQFAAHRLSRLLEGRPPEASATPMDPLVSKWADHFADAYYWSQASESTSILQPASLKMVGGCFHALALLLPLLKRDRARTGSLESRLSLTAQAQSALRQALRQIGIQEDADQKAAYELVRETAARHRIFLRRYMLANDLADPSCWSEIAARAEGLVTDHHFPLELRGQFEPILASQRRIRAGEGSARDWQAIQEGVDRLIAHGLPPSNRELREAMLPILEELPDDEDRPTGFRRVLAEIDHYLARTPASDRSTAPQPPARELTEAARLLSGRSLVLIGGIRRPEAQEALRDALGLKELIWIETKEHQSVSAFEPMIARPEVVAVLLAIRWSSHGFGDVKQFCDLHCKPLVRLPGGYNPVQVASQILDQCSERLGASPPPPA